jgi:phospholipid/cholesterol/gamma-HCH transport system permease protein
VSFIGETTAALVHAAIHPNSVRWRDVWQICERAGVDALPIVSLISFLLGMILAFQSAVPMKRFGAEIFVADLIGLAMLRELGPLMTAILLAGRSGRRVRRGDRHDARQPGSRRAGDDGAQPGRFLVTPRIIAAVMMTPLLSIYSDLVGVLGGALTMQSFAIPSVPFSRKWTARSI